MSIIKKTIRNIFHSARQERGDVPGWVLIAVMTVGLVMMIWAIAGPALTQLFNTAVQHVKIFR
ncbi:hypothetical protein [Tropheryma whipplei]|uniref:Uncharacterized protein n=1 Tax=Tropheryma whipplei (strain Twist) TaxID=203267 RepID=Q83GQ7_TROWT|nr:hypothetical protein [Tropheryma whipplei]AAO44289.1 unknown [Tropheryma whipplei str. Twist]